MTAPRTTPNPATSSRPERSSQRVAHKKPLAWLPWALLLALAALVGLIVLAVNAIDDDGPEGPAGDRLGQVSSSGSGAAGQDAGASTGPAPTTAPTTAASGEASGAASAAPSGDASGAASAAPSQAAAGTAAQLKVGQEDLLALSGGSLASRTGQPVTGSARVQSVVADEGFWVGSSTSERTFVHLSPKARKANGESPFQVKAGQTVRLTGRMAAVKSAPQAVAGVTATEGLAQLTEQGAFVDAESIQLTG